VSVSVYVVYFRAADFLTSMKYSYLVLSVWCRAVQRKVKWAVVGYCWSFM